MSILPWVRDLADYYLSDFISPDGLDGDFGLSLHPREFRRNNKFNPRMYFEYPRHNKCPYALNRRAYKVQGGEVFKKGDRNESAVGKDGFQVCMDVQQFKPNELTVKTVDNAVVVEGKHEEREDDHGFISRHFVRKYTLPKGYDAKEVVSTLSSDGILTVKAPPPPPPKQSAETNERVVQIQQTGPAHLTVKENPKEVENGAAGGDKNDKMED